MEKHYKAFISYRHLPLDMELAKKIQARIEHYGIPRELRKNGEKKLGKVFRDQDELPISGSLSDSIRAALDDTEYLIVICTPQTKESPWVMSEIDYFIESHGRDHVLAVLGEGRPEEAFPPQLTEIADENGNRMQQVEPLAANVAADTERKRNKLFRTESLRILAALIGCSYDDLYKREQRYKKRRLVTVGLAAALVVLGFVGMLVNRNMQIRANYEQALRSQSEYLASESGVLLEDGDRLGAISLALAALPDENNGRPLVPEAEYALGNAVGAYSTPDYFVGTTVSTAGQLRHTSNVEDFIMNEDATLLVSLTANGMITGWDTETYGKLWTVRTNTSGYFVTLAGFRENGDVIAWEENRIYCINGRTGEQVWTVGSEEVFQNESLPRISGVWLPAEADTVIVMGHNAVYRLNGTDGKTVSAFNLKNLSEEGYYSVVYNQKENVVSPDGSKIAVTHMTGDSYDETHLTAVDLDQGVLIAESAAYGSSSLTAPGSETLVTCLIKEDTLYYVTRRTSGSGTYILMGMSAYTKEEYRVYCMDLQTGEIRWTSDHECNFPGFDCRLIYTDTFRDEPSLLMVYSNHIDIIDAASGEVRGRTEFDSAILSIRFFDDRLKCITHEGSCGTIYPNKLQEWYSAQYFVSDLNVAALQKDFNFWVCQKNAREILHYYKQPTDPAYTEIGAAWKNDEQKDNFGADAYLFKDGICAILDSNSRTGASLLLGEADPSKPLQSVSLPEHETYGSYTLGGLHDGVLDLIFTSGKLADIVYLNTETLELSNYTIEDKKMDTVIAVFPCNSGENTRWAVLSCGARSYEINGYPLYISLFDEKTELLAQYDAGITESTYDLKYHYDAVNGHIYIYSPEQNELKRFNTADGSSEVCGEALTNAVQKITDRKDELKNCIFYNAAGNLKAVTEETDLVQVFRDDEPLYSFRTQESNKIVAIRFAPDGNTMFIIEDDGCLYRYSLPDGVLLGSTALRRPSGSYTAEKVTWQDTEKGFMIVSLNKIANLVYTEDWSVRAVVPGAFAYQEEADRFWYNSAENIGCFTRHTVDSLKEYGRSLLGGWEMTDAQKARYGLD